METKDFIATRDIEEVARIHSNPEYLLWKCEVVDGEYRFYSPNYKKTKDLTFYHGGSTKDFSIDSLDVYRTSIKQGKNYAGFYMFGEEKRDKAFHYAEMANNRLGVKDAGVSKITIDSNANIFPISGGIGKIDRLTKEELESYRSQGIDIITGKSFDGQQYVLLNKELVKSIEFQTMDMRYSNSDFQPVIEQQITTPSIQEEIMVSLDSLQDVLSESGYLCFGHGTGRTGNSDEVVNSIFQEGLRTKDNSLYFTTIGLSTPTPELIAQYQELGIETPTMDGLKQQFNNWSHADSKKIIIARIPTEYINEAADRSDIGGERYGAFMTEEIDANGKTTNYLDPKFIVGCFDVETQMVKLNKTFEKELSESTIKQLKEKYKKALQKTQARLEQMQSENIVGLSNQEMEQQTIDYGLPDFDSENIDWDIPEETNTIGRSR